MYCVVEKVSRADTRPGSVGSPPPPLPAYVPVHVLIVEISVVLSRKKLLDNDVKAVDTVS